MANEKIIFDTEVKVGSSVGSVKSLKAELRAITNELGTLEVGSEAFVKAASKAGELKDKIADVKDTVAAFNPEAKFQALAGAVGIAANGFSAMQGAMSLMGAESEDLNKVMAKTQGAIALATGLNGLLGMGDAFKLLGAQVIKIIPSLNAMGAAMLGAITGGVAIALVLIISYWKDLKFMITGTIDEVKLGTKEMQEAVAKGHEEFKKAADERNSTREREAKLKLKGKDLDIELAKIEKQRKIDEAVASGKLASEKILIEKEYQKSISDINKKYADEQKAKDKKELEYKKDFEKLKLDQQLKNLEEEKKILDIKKENEELDRKERERISEEDFNAELNSVITQGETLTAQYYKDKQSEIEIDKLAIEAKKQLLQTSSSIFGSLSELAGRQTAEGKTLAIAQATIDTYLSASSAYAAAAKIDPLVLAPLAAGAAIVAGFARVKAIAEVQVPGASGSGGGGGAVAAPSAPRIPQSFSGARLGGNSEVITKTNGQVQKVIVTETDITKTQDKVKGIIRKATIK
jgi:hypothetical protein